MIVGRPLANQGIIAGRVEALARAKLFSVRQGRTCSLRRHVMATPAYRGSQRLAKLFVAFGAQPVLGARIVSSLRSTRVVCAQGRLQASCDEHERPELTTVKQV